MAREDILKGHLNPPEEQSVLRRDAQTLSPNYRRKLNRTLIEQEESFRKPYQNSGGI